MKAPVAAVWLGISIVLAAEASESADPSDAGRPSPEQIAAWLESHSIEVDTTRSREIEASPPLPPRYRGWVIEGGIGALGYIGTLRHVSSISPRFNLLVGYEITRWAMVLAESDLTFSNTRYAPPPPEPRGYELYGFGGGARFGLDLSNRLAAFLQLSIGAGRVNEDILATYGYSEADSLHPYFGGGLGLEWFQVNPRLALVLNLGVRNYPTGLNRVASTETPLVWLANPALKYTF